MTDASQTQSVDAELLEYHPADPIQSGRALQIDVADRPSNYDGWSDLSLSVPNHLPTARIVSFVECVLVELTHEPVGAVYRSNEEWGMVETMTVDADRTSVARDADFVRYRRDPRNGSQVSTKSRREVRDALVSRLSRDFYVPVALDRFTVEPLPRLSRQV